MRRTLALVLSAALCGPALAQTAPAPSISESTGLNSLVGTAPSTQDFVTQAAISDMFEMQSSKLAAGKKDGKAQAFAQKMIADHTMTTQAIKGMVDGGKLKATIPTALDSSHQSKIDKLKGAGDDAFEAQFRDDQISAHKDAVDLYKRYAQSGENAELKAFAAKTLPTLQAHLDMANGLAK